MRLTWDASCDGSLGHLWDGEPARGPRRRRSAERGPAANLVRNSRRSSRALSRSRGARLAMRTARPDATGRDAAVICGKARVVVSSFSTLRSRRARPALCRLQAARGSSASVRSQTPQSGSRVTSGTAGTSVCRRELVLSEASGREPQSGWGATLGQPTDGSLELRPVLGDRGHDDRVQAVAVAVARRSRKRATPCQRMSSSVTSGSEG
jgi:hypothetical protein